MASCKFEHFLRNWYLSQEQLQRNAEDNQQVLPRRRFPQFYRIIDAHLNRRASPNQNPGGRSRRINGGAIYRSGSEMSDERLTTETRMEKQLRKAIGHFKQSDYFKSLCCYRKVSLRNLRHAKFAKSPVDTPSSKRYTSCKNVSFVLSDWLSIMICGGIRQSGRKDLSRSFDKRTIAVVHFSKFPQIQFFFDQIKW